MTEFSLSVEMIFVSNRPTTSEQFEAFLDEVLAELQKLGYEVNLAARLRDRVADFAASVEADSYHQAEADFLTALRTALHAAGCSTARWSEFALKQQSTRQLQDV